MSGRLRNMGDTVSSLDPTLTGIDREIADLCSIAAASVAKVIAAFGVVSVGRIGAPATQTALFSALAAEAAEQLAMGVVVTGADPEEAIEHGCEALRANFEKRLAECRVSFAEHLAEEAREATKQ